jgi:hypothetical protein
MSNSTEKNNWNIWYIAVLGFLVLQVVLYYIFTQYWA